MSDQDRETAAVKLAMQDLRAAELANVPVLDAVLTHRPAARTIDAGRMAGVLAAAAMLLAAGNVVRIALKPRLVVPAEVMALSSWRPMTDALLERLPEVTVDAPLTASLLPAARPDSAMERTP